MDDLSPNLQIPSSETEIVNPPVFQDTPSQTVGGWAATSGQLSRGSVTLDATSEQIRIGAATTPAVGLGIFLGKSAGVYQFRVGDPAGNNILWNGTTLTVSAAALTGSVPAAALNIADRGWSQTSVFSVTDADTIAWGAGTFTSADGTAYSIGGGNTGNMAAKTFIYLDIAVSTTAYQTTTTGTTAVGAGKVMIAVAQNGTGEATYEVLQGQGGKNIDAANIVAGSITANELSTSITYAGAIVIDTAGNIRSGQTAYNTGTGWFIGNVAGTPKLSIGNPTGKSLTWDGTDLLVNGYSAGGDISFSDGSDGDVTISGNTTLSADKFYNNLTVNAGFTLTTAGYRIFVKGTLTINGTIDWSGSSGGTGGAGGTPTAGSAGSAGAALSSANLYGSLAGVAGATGGAGASLIASPSNGGTGSVGTTGTNGTNQTLSLFLTTLSGSNGDTGATGGNGGDDWNHTQTGGAAAAGGVGGTGGTITLSQTRIVSHSIAIQLTNIFDTSSYANSTVLLRGGSSAATSGGGGGGGGGGSRAGEAGTRQGGGGGGSAGSGSNGGNILIVADIIIVGATGIIQGNGGAGGVGGIGGNGEDANNKNYIGSGGGGGGGTGGTGGTGSLMVILARKMTIASGGKIQALGGDGGVGGVGGNGGFTRDNGTQGGVAGNGGNGGKGGVGGRGGVIYLYTVLLSNSGTLSVTGGTGGAGGAKGTGGLALNQGVGGATGTAGSDGTAGATGTSGGAGQLFQINS